MAKDEGEEIGPPEFLGEETPGKRQRRERFRPGIAERERRRKAVFGVVLLVVIAVVFGGVFFLVSVYEKPAETLAVEVPAGDVLEFSGWQASSKQQWENVNRGGRIYKDTWRVDVSGAVKNPSGKALEINGLEIDVVNKKGEVVYRRSVHMTPLQPGEARTISVHGRCDDAGRPQGVVVRVASSPVSKDISDLADEIEQLHQKFKR